MSTLYNKWMTDDEDNNEKLRQRVGEFCKTRKEYKLSNLTNECEVPNLSGWLNRHARYLALPTAQYLRLVLHGITNGWLESDTGAFYREFNSFLGNLQSDGVGTETIRHYEVHRFSCLAKGYVLRGSLTISQSKGSSIVTTKEYYCIQADVAKLFSLGERDAPFPRTGFLFPRGQNAYLMLSRKDRYPDELQTAYLEAAGADNSFSGPFSDWHGRVFYSARMIATIRKSALPTEDVLTIQQNEVPPDVLRYLTETPAGAENISNINKRRAKSTPIIKNKRLHETKRQSNKKR